MENVTKSELPDCPVETTLMLISDKWKVLILRDLLPGTKRFGELRKSIGQVSQKVLTAQLRQMEEEEPQLHVTFDQRRQEIRVEIMGPVQLEVLKELLKEAYDFD